MEAQHQNSYYDIHWAEETARYVYRIMALKEIMENPADYGFDITEEDKYKPYAFKTVSVDTAIHDLPQWAKDNGTTYRILRLLNPSLLKQKLSAPKKPIEVRLPLGGDDLTATE